MSKCGCGLHPAGQPGSSSSEDEPRSVFAPLAAVAPVQGELLMTPRPVVHQPVPPPMKRPKRHFHGGGAARFRVGPQRAEAREREGEPHHRVRDSFFPSSSYSQLAAPAPVPGQAEAEKQEGEPHHECVIPHSLSSPHSSPGSSGFSGHVTGPRNSRWAMSASTALRAHMERQGGQLCA